MIDSPGCKKPGVSFFKKHIGHKSGSVICPGIQQDNSLI